MNFVRCEDVSWQGRFILSVGYISMVSLKQLVLVVKLCDFLKENHFSWILLVNNKSSPRGGGGVLPYNRLMGMCRWMGSHFHNWIDYNGVAFSKELLEWGRTVSDFGG